MIEAAFLTFFVAIGLCIVAGVFRVFFWFLDRAAQREYREWLRGQIRNE